MAGDKFDQLYNALKADGAVSGTREHFRQFVYAPGRQGYHNRKQLYDALHADGAVSSKSYEEFAQRLGLHAVNPKPRQQKPAENKAMTAAQRAMQVAQEYQQTHQPADYLHRPQNQMGRARRNSPGKASPFVQSLYEIDNSQKGPDYSVDYTSPKATRQVYQQNQQVRRQAAKTAGDHIVNDEYRRQSQPMIDNGTVGVMKPMGEIEQEMSDSASRFVDANLGDYINDAVLGEQDAAGRRAADAYNSSFAAGGGGGGGVNDLLMRSLAYNEENDPDKMIENLAKNARGGLEKLFQNPSFVAKVQNEADMLGVTPEAYVESILPHLKDRLSAALEKSEYNKYLPKDAFENMANRFIDSNTIGKLVRGATMTRGQRVMQERASAATAAGENPYYKGSTVENVVADVAGMVSDPVFKGAAGAGGKVAGKLIGNSTRQAALMANGNLAQRLMAKGAQAVTSGGVTGFVFDSTGSVIQNYSTGEDTSLWNTLKVAAKGGATGAVNFATMSLAGIPLSEVGRSVGLTGIKGGSFWGNAGRATAKVGLESGKTYMEAMGMYLGGYVSGKLEGRTDASGKPVEFDLWDGTMESLPTAIGFRLQHAVEGLRGGRKNEKGEDMGWFGSTIANFKDFLTSDKAKESRFLMTEDERNMIFSSGAMNGLMPDGENIVSYAKRTKNKKVSHDDPYLETDASMIKNTYDQIMADPKVSWDAKAKFSAMVTGIMPSARPMMDYITFSNEDYVKDGLLRGKRKYVNEYSANGELLSKIPYDNREDRDNVVYTHNIKRENLRLYNAMGLLARQDRNNYGLQNDFFVENMKKPGADVNTLVTNMGNEGSDVFRDFSLFALNSEKGTVLKTIDSVAVRNGMKSEDLIKAMKKNPMKRTDFEQNACVELRRALEAKAFPDGKVHVEQSNLNGKDVAEDNNLGTEQPNGDAVKQELNGLRQAEEEVEVLMRDNDVFSQNFKKLQSQGLTNPQIYDWMVQQGGLTVEQLEPFAHYINANARVQGMQDATKQKIEETVSAFVQDWSYHGILNGQPMNGEQALYVQDSNGRTLLVGSGDVAFDQTSGRAREGSGDMLVCFDPNTREMAYVKADEVTLFQNQPIDQFAAEYRQRLQMKNSEPYNQAAQEQALQDAAKPQQEQEAPQDDTTKSEDSTTKEGDLIKDNTTLTKADTTSGKDNTTNEDLVPQEQPQPGRKSADGTEVPMTTDSKGRPTPDYASMTPEQSAEILTEDFGDNAGKVVDGQIQKAEKALKDAEKMKVDYTAEPNDIMEQEALKNQTVEAAKKQLDHAHNIKKAMTAKKVAETVGKTEQNEGAHEAGSVAAQKFVNAPRLAGNKRTRMLADGETKIRGHYEIVPAESLTPSHDVNNDYKKSEGFPTDAEGRTVNDRDYEHDKAAQQNTDQIAGKYNGMAIEQVPVVSDEGIVYDGNGRTMAGQKAAKEGTDGEYINDLLENAENFGFTREQIEQSGIGHPRLVLVTDERLPYDTATFSKFNRNEKKTQSNTEQAVAKAKTLTSDEVGAIVAEIEGNGSLDAFFNNSKAINDLVKTLVDKGIIGQNEVAQMMDSPERLSAQGREYVKNLLLGSIFKPETIRMLGIDSTVKNKAVNAIRSVMDNMKLGEFSLRDEIDQAIQLLYEARQGGNKVDTLLRTPDMFGEDAAKRYSSISQMMALALEGKVADFRDLLDEYNRIAASRNTGEGSIFEAAPTKEELVNEYLNFKKWQDYGTGRSENEGGNDVSGVEEPQQEASGGNEPAEAERPGVEEADDLENKEPESRIEVTDEGTETPSKNGPIMKQKILIDGDKEVIKVDEPNDKGEYTGSYYEYAGKKFGDLNEVTGYIDSKNEEGPLPLLPKEENPDPQFNPTEAAAAEFKKEHPLTEDEIMKADVDDLSKDMALDYLNGEVTDDLHRAIYESIYAKRKGLKAEPKVETPEAEPSADPVEGIKNAAEAFEKEKKTKAETEKKPQQTADDAAVAASNKKVNDLWDMLKNAGKDEMSASFVGLNSRQLEVLPKLVSAMAENTYLRIKRGMHNLEDVVKEMRKEFAPAAKVFKKEDVDAIYEQMMNIRYRDGEQRMSLKEWADYYEKTSPKHQENLAGDSKNAEQRKQAEKNFVDAVSVKLAFGDKLNGIVELRKIAERLGLKDIKDTDLQELAETAIVKRARGIASSDATDNAEKFKRIKTLYENQPSLNQRDSERVMKGQFSTPAPYAFLADMYVKGNGKVIESALEPSAGNGMLTIGLPMDKVHVNDIDDTRLLNLNRQGFGKVTSQDGTQPFNVKPVDIVITNPPFGSATPRDYDGYRISSLEGQMAINALDSMKGDGRAAIIIGGNTEYAKNGSLRPKDKAFLGYLYSHYNVEDVINVDGSLFAKQGTTFPTRMILINGRRLNENAFPPVKDKARAETVKDYDELYKRIEDDILRGERMDSSIGGETGSAQSELDQQGSAGTPKEGVRTGERGGSEPDGKRGSDVPDTSSVSGTHDDLANQRGTEPREDGGLSGGDTGTDRTGTEPSQSEGATAGTNEQRGNGSGGVGRNDAQPSTDEPANAGSGSGPRGQLQRVDKSVRGLSTEKVTYTPKSGNPFTLKAVMPADQQEAVNKNLEKLGDADQFLVDELGYNDKDDLYSHLAAEQVDSVALALQQAKKGNAFIIGDMTGIGKGRQAASLIRYAKKQGQVPVYFTKTAGLLSDVYRDLVDIGSPELRPFVFGSAKEAAITDSDGNVVFALPSKSEVKRVLDYIEKNGKLPEEYDYVLTTYSQVSNGVYEFDENGARKEKKLAKGKTFGAAALSGQRRRDAIEKLMDNAYLILDESHTAGGNSGQGNYFQHIIQKAKNVTFFSATFAKRPDNMPIYALRTAMNGGGMKSSDLIDAVKRGGATLQEIMSQTLTQCGQMIRRERDMTGVTIDWKAIDDPERVQEQREQYDGIIGLFNDIINFQKKYVSGYVDKRNEELAEIQSTIGIKRGTDALGIKNQPFASKAFNTVQQVLLSLKAKSAAERAIDYLKQGMKPVIALNNTNESQTGNLALGEEMDAPDLGTSLKKGLEGTLRYTQKDAKDNSESGYIKLEDLGDEAIEAYHELEKKIEQTSTGLSLSPIDVIKNELQKAGYKVGELTGRQTEFVYNDNGTVTKVKRVDTDKKKLARDFNDGKIDALILNKSAATGISLHASSKYKDQKKRVMIVAQQQLDVNDEVQMRGRIDRTGQVARGAYEYVVSLIPAEQRLLMMFKAKLKSLDANTTSSQKSKFNEMEVADITNKYGDKVVREYMAEHLDLYSRMADPFGWEKSLGEDLSRIDPQRLVAEGGGVGDGEAGADASKLLGRMALLRVSEQEKMLQEIGELYANEIQRLNEMGENDLEITELPLKAKTIRKEVWKQGAEPGGDNAFADNTYIEKVNMAILKKPVKAAEVKASQEGLTGGKTWEEYKTEKKTAVKEYFDQKIADETQRYEERAVKVATKAKEKYIKDAKKGQKDSGMSDEQIEKMAGYQYDNIYKQEKDKLNDVVKNLKAKAEMFARVLDTFDTNSAFVLPADMNNPNELSGFGNSYGRLIDIKITDNFSPNASSVSFATLDGRRKITFPIAGKVGAGDNKADVISAIDNMTKQAAGMGDSHLRVLNQKFDNWDRLTSNESRKNGYIVTGNLMQALVDSKDQGLGGQLVKYTTDTGEVKTGILMPDRFDPKGLTTDAPINSVAEKFELSSWRGGIDEVTSSDGEVKVKRIDNNRGNFYELRVPKSKAKGGKYFLDKDLLKLVNGNNFETRGNNMLAEFKPEQLKPVLDRLSKMGVKVQEERKTSEDEGTHFREDRGLQYSKTDTKDVKNSRIIPEDVDKTVSLQIEKKFDDEINRLFTHVTPNIRRWANAAIDLYSKDQTLNSWEVDENKNVTLSEGLNTVIDDLTKKINEYETKYGIRKDANIGELVNSILRKINSEGSGSGRNTSDKGQQEGTGGEAKTLPGGGGERRALDVLNDYKALSIRKAAAERAKAYILARSKSLQGTYGLKKNEPVSYETIDRIFNDYNSDPEIKELYDSIVNSLRSLGTEFYVGSIELARTKGYYKHSENFIKLNVDRLSAAGYTKQNLASTLCHEMLHPLTSDIIAMYQKGHTDKLSPSQIEAAKDAVDIYNELVKMQKDDKLGDYYGLENPREMITELASPEWRSALRNIPAAKKWYQKLINAICRMIGKDPKYNKLGEMERTLTKLLDNFGKEQFDFASQNENELFGKEPQGSKVTDPEEIKRLEEEPKIKVYRAMQVIDGKLYPPMAAYADGKLVEANELGKWIKADEMPDSKNTVYKYKGTTTTIPKDRAVKGEDGIWRDSKNGAELAVGEDGNPTWYFKLQKGKGATGKKLTDVPAAYNPYWHTSYSPLNDQFKSAWIRPNVVVVECEVPAGELTSGYRAEHAKDSVGMTPWTSGVVTKQLVAKGHEGRKVMLSRWCKPVRIVPDEEVAAKIKDFIGDYDVEIPENVVTPRQKVELEKLGVKIGAPEKGMNKNEQISEAIKLGLQVDNTVLSEDGTKFREDHGYGNYPASSVESHVEKVAQKTGGKVQMVSSVDEITNKAAKDAIEEGRKITGWYDEKTGEVHLYMPNIHDRYTAEKTIWHEVVGHKGMRELFGDERFDKFLRDVWYDLDKPENAALKKLVDEERKFNPLNIYDAIEEGIARLAEDGKGESGFWNGIKNKVSDFLHEIGYRIVPNTKDVKYLLWLSKNLQKNPNDPYWKMRAEAVKYRLDHERMPAVVAHDGMFYGNDGKVRSMESLTKSEWDEATDGQIHFRTTPSAGTALDRYHRSLDEHGYMFTESYMDNMLSLKKLMNAIVPDKKIEDIASSENPYILQNTMQGAMSDAAQMFERNVMKPLDKAMADVLDAFDGKKDDEKIRNFNLYTITKHGLERNREFFVRDFLRNMRMDEQKKQDADFLENSYYSDKEYLDNELKAGSIDLKEYYRQLDESIRNHFDADFEAGEHDYSGMHAIQEVAKSSDPYNDAEAIQSVMDSEAKMESIKKGAVKDYWDKVKAATQYSIDSDYRNGIISKELHGHVSNMFNWYVPLRKYDEATAEDTYGYITELGDPKSYIGSTIMRARGHKYLSETNVLAQIGAMGNRAIKNGGMNAIRQAFARFARNNSGNNLITETSVWYEKDPVVNIVYERYPDIPEGATADEINHIVSDFNKDMKMKESQGLAYKVYRRDKIGYKFQRAENKSQHIVDVKIAGRTHTFIINGNPRAAQALNGLLEHKNDKLAGRVTASISRKMAQLCTSYNPEFVMRNMIKDFEFASTNLLAKEGLVYTKRFEQYYAKVGIIEGIRNSKLKDFADTGGFGLYAKYRNGTLDTTNKLHRYFKEFMENGGETGWVQIKNMEDFTKEYKAHVKTERNKIQKVGMGIYDAIFTNLENINEIAENLARFATYCASRDSNRSVIRSVYDAKEVSTNFNRHGSGNAIYSFKNGEMGTGKTARKNIYGFTAAWFRNSSMFFNAGIQSTNLLVKNFKNNKAGTIGYIASAPFISGMAMALLNNFIISNEDEKDRKGVKDPYAELPDYIRRNNLCVYIGGGEFVTIPLAIEERAFYGLGDFAAGMTFSKNISSQKMPNLTENKDIDKYLNPFMDAVGCMSQLVPVADYLGNASFGKHPVQETIKAVAPSATSPFLEWVYNSDWKGAPIQQDNKFDENQPSWMLAYKGTPEWMINMNKKVNALTNDVAPGNEDMKGNDFLDEVTNPSALHHFYGSYFGGAATFVERVDGLIKNGKDTETKDIPFLRSLLYTPNEQSSLQRTKSKWYNYKDEMEKTMANVDRLKSKNVPLDKRITNIGEYYQFQNSKEAAKVRVIELAEKQMERWKKMKGKASDTESINFANQNIDRIMMDAVDELDRLE
nr:MAG TPA_asm: P-loop containing NTP hydrolase pore-1 [Caudoviricetes sp.]